MERNNDSTLFEDMTQREQAITIYGRCSCVRPAKALDALSKTEERAVSGIGLHAMFVKALVWHE